MKQNIAAVLVFVVVSLFGTPVMAADNYILAEDDLSISVFCAEYQGNRYDFVLRYAPEADPGGLFWKMDINTLQPAQNECQSLLMGNDLSFDVKVSFQNADYRFVLRYTPIPADPDGVYWKLDKDTVRILDSGNDNLILAGDDLSLPVFCAEYGGGRYDFVLRYAPETDPGGFFWKMDMDTVKIAQNGCPPLPVGNDLALDVAVNFQDTVYGFVLRYTPIPADPDGFYWKLDVDTFTVLDSMENLSNDIEQKYLEGNVDIMGERTSESYLFDGENYDCNIEYWQWNYGYFSYENAAYIINSVTYQNENGKVVAEINRTLSFTMRAKANPADFLDDSSTNDVYYIFEDGKWKNYGNQQGAPSPSASDIVTCESVDETVWEPVGVKNTFTSADQEATVFVNLFNIHNGSSINFKLYKPDGTIEFDDTGNVNWGDFPTCVTINNPFMVIYTLDELSSDAGIWRVEVYADNVKVGEVSFTYTP